MSNSWPRKYPRLASEPTPAPAESTGRTERAERASASPEPSPYLAGEVIGDRYRLVRELGRGGMGVVWVGYALALGVEVAVKLIRASAAGPAISSRMAREAHAAARLGHPALVRVFDFGWTSRGDPYLVMELVQGETLSATLAREGRISAIRAVQMVLPLADGLRLAHDRSIVHRDIKPDNIFLATDPLGRMQPKLLDFGIAKVGAGNIDGRLTQVGVVLGSPEYMSPEQALGAEDVDERTDVWSLSVVLYEMVTGTVPFRKSNYNALMQSIIHDPPQAMTDQAEVDESLWDVVARGLAKEREQRWTSMVDLGEALALWLYEHGIKEDICGNSIRAVWLDGVQSTVRVEAIPTPPPMSHVSAGHPRFSRTASTMERRDAGLASPTDRAASRRRPVVAAAAVLGAVVGGIVAATLLQRGPVAKADEPTPAKPIPSYGTSPPEVTSAAPAPRGISPEELPRVTDAASTSSGTGSGREMASRTGPVSVTKQKATPSSTTIKTSPRSGKKRHDFGF